MGRGGAQHKATQKRIKEAAASLGFRSVIEKSVLDGQGSVDLWLERPPQSFACEISFTTTIEHEVQNVAKCLKAGLPKVAIICMDKERLQAISTAVMEMLGPEAAARVEYFEPDAFIAHLKQLKRPEPKPAKTEYAGYEITRSEPKLTASEREQKEKLANHIISEVLRGK